MPKNRKLAMLHGSRKPVLLIIIFVIAASLVLFLKGNHTKPTDAAANNQSAAIKALPAAVPIDKNSKTSASTSATAPPSNSASKKVTPIITSATQSNDELVVRAYVSDIFETGGTCTAILSSTSKPTSSKSSEALENVSYTSCKPISFDSSLLGKGSSWQLIVQYKSADAAGSSNPQTVRVE